MKRDRNQAHKDTHKKRWDLLKAQKGLRMPWQAVQFNWAYIRK